LLSTPSRDDAVTDPSPPHIANSAGETFTRLITAFTDAHLSLYFLYILFILSLFSARQLAAGVVAIFIVA